MPVFWFEDQAGYRVIKNEDLLFLAVVGVYTTASMNTNQGIPGFVMPVATSLRLTRAVNVKYAFDGTGDDFFKDCEVTRSGVKCIQLY